MPIALLFAGLRALESRRNVRASLRRATLQAEDWSTVWTLVRRTARPLLIGRVWAYPAERHAVYSQLPQVTWVSKAGARGDVELLGMSWAVDEGAKGLENQCGDERTWPLKGQEVAAKPKHVAAPKHVATSAKRKVSQTKGP